MTIDRNYPNIIGRAVRQSADYVRRRCRGSARSAAPCESGVCLPLQRIAGDRRASVIGRGRPTYQHAVAASRSHHTGGGAGCGPRSRRRRRGRRAATVLVHRKHTHIVCRAVCQIGDSVIDGPRVPYGVFRRRRVEVIAAQLPLHDIAGHG